MESAPDADTGHTPVMLSEVLSALRVKLDGSYLDATGGAGGHAAAILERLGPVGRLIVCDWNAAAAKALQTRFCDDTRVRVMRESFSRIFENVTGDFDGILADFGISSLQLEGQAPGISFLRDADPLDMRLDDRKMRTAADILAEASADELADIFFHLGGERASRKIAAAIAADRALKEFKHVQDLKTLCERVLGRFYRGKGLHPATKIFQALRIRVNGELEEIRFLLEKAPMRLKPGGNLVVIAFHEGEDRLVKQAFRALAAGPSFELPVRKALQPSRNEVLKNPRARSARLRIIMKVEPSARHANTVS